MDRVHVVVLHPGTPRYGLWCPSCLVSSGVECDVWSLRADCLLRVGTFRRCVHCRGPVEGQPTRDD